MESPGGGFSNSSKTQANLSFSQSFTRYLLSTRSLCTNALFYHVWRPLGPHKVKLTGEYITAKDDRVKRIIDSWRGVRPTMHYSVSREDVLVGHDPNTRPDMDTLLEQGYKKQKLRAHSDFYWNNAVNNWAWTFTKDFDMMCESKAKNLASIDFYAKTSNAS